MAFAPLSPSLPARVGGEESNASDGGLGKGLSRGFTRAVEAEVVFSFEELLVGVLAELPLLRKRVDQDGGMDPEAAWETSSPHNRCASYRLILRAFQDCTRVQDKITGRSQHHACAAI